MKEGNDIVHGRDRDIFLQLYPGQIYDLDEQCKMVYGPNSLYCGVRMKIYSHFNYVVLINYLKNVLTHGI